MRIIENMKSILNLALMLGIFFSNVYSNVYADDFESGISDWTAIKENSSDVANLTWEKLNTYDDSIGALRVVMRIPKGQTRTTSLTGARYNCTTISAASRVKISFKAKSLYGSQILNIVSENADSTPGRVKITPYWKSYEVEIDVATVTDYLVFSSVDIFDGIANNCVTSGEFILDDVTVSTISETYVKNPYFSSGTSNWQGYNNGTVDTSIISNDISDGPDGESGYLKVDIDTATLLYSHQSGASCTINNIAANSRLRVTFWAKHISGSNYLNVERMYGGGSRAQVILSGEWKKYSLVFDEDYTTGNIIFNPVEQLNYSGFSNVTSGEFLLDNVHVDVVDNSVSNYLFESSINDWSGLTNGTTDSSVISHETSDTWGGSSGALKVNIDLQGGSKLSSHISGAQFSDALEAYDRIKVSFWAKSVSGSPYLNIERLWGGTIRDQVTLNSSWKRYEVYLDLPYASNIVFNTVDAIGFSGYDHVVDGIFLLDNVILSPVEEASLTAPFSYVRPGKYSDFTSITSYSSLSDAIANEDYIYLPPGDYTISNPITIDRDTPLYIHGGNRMSTRLIPSDNTKPLFIIKKAPLINISGVCPLGPEVAEYRSFVFENFVPTIFEMHACFLDRAAVEIKGRGSFTFQGVVFSMRGYSKSGVIVDHPLADTFIIGGNTSSSGASAQSTASEYFHFIQKQGRLRLFSTGMQGALGPADVKISSASTIGPHMIANVRTEGTTTNNTSPSVLLHVPTTSSQVDVIVMNNSINTANTDGEAVYVDYNAGGNLWLMGNNSISDVGKLVTGTAATGATVIASGNYLYTNADMLPITGATKIFAGNMYNYYKLTGDSTFPRARWVNPSAVLSSYSDIPVMQEVTVPEQIELPVVDTVLGGMINVKNSPYNAVGDGVTDDTTAIQSALNAGKMIYFPEGTYLVTSPLGYSHSTYGATQKSAGGWIAGAGSDKTKIIRRLTDKGSVFLSEGIAYFTIQGISFETAAYDSTDQNTITVPCVSLEFLNYGHATQEVMLYDCEFIGGRYAAGLGIFSPTQCSEIMFINCLFKNAKYGLSTGGFNALANLVCNSLFENNEIATGACEEIGYYQAGTWALFHTTIDGSYGRDFWPKGTSSGVWYFHRVFSNSNKLYEQGGTSASYMYSFDHCEFTPNDPVNSYFSFDVGAGALFAYTLLDPGAANFGSGPMSVKYGLKLYSDMPAWNSDPEDIYLVKKP
jgi:Pectate lyase superfamily protein